MKIKLIVGDRFTNLTENELIALAAAISYAHKNQLPGLLPRAAGTAAAKLRVLVKPVVSDEKTVLRELLYDIYSSDYNHTKEQVDALIQDALEEEGL